MITVASSGELNREFIKDFSINSFCSVVTKEVCREAHILALSINSIYSRPIIFYCDQETFLYFRENKVVNVKCIVVNFVTPKSVKKHNNYHRSDAISRKMDVMSYCIQRYGNAIFLDADIVILHPISGPSFCNVALSYNSSLLSDDFSITVKGDGAFNAGMIWSSSIEFVDWWKDQYLNKKSKFYEQECLNRIPSKFTIDLFDINHNYGFWRGCSSFISRKTLLSIHCHLDLDFIHKIKNDWIRGSIIKFRSDVVAYLKTYHKDLMVKINGILK